MLQKDFFGNYPGIKSYCLPLDEDEKEHSQKNQIDPSNIETSFFMIITLIIFGLLNLLFIFNSREIDMNNIKIEYLNKKFDNTLVSKDML